MLEERNLEEALGAEPTLSGAVVYAHYKTPLDEVMQEAHAMLDDVAKERTGRDSLAISVLKSSGKQYEWSMPWDDESCSLPLLDGFTPGDPRPTLVDELVDRYCEGEYTSSFIYRLRELFMLLADPPRWRPGTFVDVPGRLDPRALFVSEYVGSTERGVEPEEVEARIERLLDASWWHERGEGTDENRLGFDAPLLVRFLAQERMKVQS
jgi:CRISPR-associated protein Cmr2